MSTPGGADATPRHIDTLLLDIASVVTCDDGEPGPLCGRAQDDLAILKNGGVAIHDGLVVGVGPSASMAEAFRADNIECLQGKTLLPGLIDAHTHPVFARWRDDEYEMRCRGADYEAILAAGGGIHASAAATRAAGRDALMRGVHERLDAFARHGVAAIEAKSGYGLSLESELLSLEVLRDVARDHVVHVERTFLGAHVVPTAYQDRREAYVRLLIDKMIPRVVEQELARFIDVFVEANAFTIDEGRRILEAGKAVGLVPKVHADQFRDGGGAQLAAELGAVSVEHVDATGAAGIASLAEAGVVAVLLPTAGVFTGLAHRANARGLIDAGVPVALSTDLNPGTSPTSNLPLAASLGTCLLGMTPSEAIVAITRNAACAMGCDDTLGRIAVGRPARFTELDAAHPRALTYHMGSVPIRLRV